MNKVRGFTLVEIIVVIVILGILAVTAAPRFLNLQSDARAAVIENLDGSFKEAHTRLYAKAQIGNNLLPIENSNQYWVDMNGNGVIDEDSVWDQYTMYGKDSPDVMMINDSHIDNHQLLKLVDISDGLIAYIPKGSRHQSYIGFDTLGDGDINKGNYRVYYNNDSGTFFRKTDGC